jgi:hypothetical protein
LDQISSWLLLSPILSIEGYPQHTDTVNEKQIDVVITANHGRDAFKPQMPNEDYRVIDQINLFREAQGVGKVYSRERAVEIANVFHLRDILQHRC